MNVNVIIKQHYDTPLYFQSFRNGVFEYYLKELKLLIELLPNRIRECEFSNQETIETLFEQIDFNDELDFTLNGKFIGSISKQVFENAR